MDCAQWDISVTNKAPILILEIWAPGSLEPDRGICWWVRTQKMKWDQTRRSKHAKQHSIWTKAAPKPEPCLPRETLALRSREKQSTSGSPICLWWQLSNSDVCLDMWLQFWVPQRSHVIKMPLVFQYLQKQTETKRKGEHNLHGYHCSCGNYFMVGSSLPPKLWRVLKYLFLGHMHNVSSGLSGSLLPPWLLKYITLHPIRSNESITTRLTEV